MALRILEPFAVVAEASRVQRLVALVPTESPVTARDRLRYLRPWGRCVPAASTIRIGSNSKGRRGCSPRTA
jgi:hypothetical protein